MHKCPHTLVSTATVEQYPCAYCESEGPSAEISFVAQQCSEVISTFFEVSSLTMAVVHFNKDPAGQVRMEIPMTLESFGNIGSSSFWLMQTMAKAMRSNVVEESRQ